MISNWNSASFHGSREEISISFQNENNTTITSAFQTVELGAVCIYRNRLFGGKSWKEAVYDTATFPDLHFGLNDTAINICRPLICYFKAHGGLGSTVKLVTTKTLYMLALAKTIQQTY